MKCDHQMISITCGDPWEDGHGRTHSETYRVLHTGDGNADVEAAYRKGLASMGIADISGNFERFEQNTIPRGEFDTIINKIGQHRSAVIMAHLEEFEGETVTMTPEAYIELWCAIAEIGSSGAIRFEKIRTQEVRIGGYGLFLA